MSSRPHIIFYLVNLPCHDNDLSFHVDTIRTYSAAEDTCCSLNRCLVGLDVSFITSSGCVCVGGVDSCET